MVFTEKQKALFYSFLLISMFILFMIFGEKKDRILYLIAIIMTISMDLLMLIGCSKWFRKNYIRFSCPNVWEEYFKETGHSKDNEPIYSTDMDFITRMNMLTESSKQSYKNMLLNSTLDIILQEEKRLSLYKDPNREIEIRERKTKIMELVNAEKNDIWVERATKYINYLSRNSGKYNCSIYNFRHELDLLEQEIEKYNKRSKIKSAIPQKEYHGDITHDDIINHNVEFEEDAIYVKEKVWDGVRYTLKRQRVFVYKRDYNLNQDIPRFHICKCSTMDEFIRAGALTTSYRKSVNKIVLVKNKDNYMQECQISHLPLCKNCYKKMKEQYSWLCSEMDNEDFIKNVIDKTPWGPDVN